MDLASTNPSSLAVLDMFCGAGGLSEGFRQAGFRIVAGSDVDPDAGATYAQNFPDAEMVVGDIREGATRERTVAAALRADVIVGGPPCQGFSQVRNHTRLIDDPRNALYREFVRVVAEVAPRAFVVENVTGMDQMDVRAQIAADLALDGEYLVVAHVHDAADYGVPQARRRLVFIGIHRSLGLRPPAVVGTGATSATGLARADSDGHSRPVALAQADLLNTGSVVMLADPWDAGMVTASQAISDLVSLETGRRDDEIEYSDLPAPQSEFQRLMRSGAGERLFNVQVPRLNEDTRLRLEAIPPGGNHRDLEERLLDRYLTGQRWGQENGSGRLSRRHFYAYRRLHPDFWAWTLNTKADAVYHYAHARALSVREFARLQSFPDRFVFTTAPRLGPIPGRVPNGSAHSRYRQVGNAVPPLLARAIADALRAALEKADDSCMNAPMGGAFGRAQERRSMHGTETEKIVETAAIDPLGIK